MIRCSFILSALLMAGAPCAPAGVLQFTLPSSGGRPLNPISVAAGPGGTSPHAHTAVWFIGDDGNSLGFVAIDRDATSATDAEFVIRTVPTPLAGISSITHGADGAMWFTEMLAGKIGRIDPATLQISEFALPPGMRPQQIATGPDGALWFTDFAPRIGRITTSGAVSEYPLPAGSNAAFAIASGVNEMWFSQAGSSTSPAAIGRITMNGVVEQYAAPTAVKAINAITVTPGGTVWFADAAGTVGYLTQGRITPIGVPGSPVAIAAARDSTIWATNFAMGMLMHFEGITMSSHSVAGAPQGLAIASDDSIWVASPSAHALIRFTASPGSTAAGKRRRAVSPPPPNAQLAPCAAGVVAKIADVTAAHVDGDYLYLADANGAVSRMPKNGGTPSLLMRMDGGVITALVTDDANLYAAVLDPDTLLGNIYSVPKAGGTPRSISSAILLPWKIVPDGDSLFVTEVGSAFISDVPVADGAIVRVRKNGSGSEKLVSNLWAPFSLAISGDDLFFTEVEVRELALAGGVRSVPKHGGSVRRIVDDLPATEVAVDAANIYFDGLDLEEQTASLRRVARSGGPVVELASNVFIYGLTLAGDALYYLNTPSDDSLTIEKVAVTGGPARTIVSADFNFPGFAVDECLVYYATPVTVERTQR